MKSDVFADLVKGGAARSVISGGFRAGAVWKLAFPAPARGRLKFFGVLEGAIELSVASLTIILKKGDVVILCARHPYVMRSGGATKSVDAQKLFSGSAGTIMQVGDGDECLVLGGHIEVRGSIVADLLPPVLHLKAGSSHARTLRWLLGQLNEEAQERPLGADVASAQLAQMMFVQLLRAHLEGKEVGGWLRALGDERLAPALQRMQTEPSRAWKLDELAKASAMSRTAFAARFKAIAGISPLAFLTEWRMHLAQRALLEDSASIAEVASSLGYGSESAFSNAFKRVTGRAPRHYRESINTADRRAAG